MLQTMNKLQYNYDLIHDFFKTTNEPYDDLEWDSYELLLILKNKIIERYSWTDLKSIISDLK